MPAANQGIDAGKKIAGRKRHIGVDTLGLLLAVLVTAASVSDNAGGIHVLSDIATHHPGVTKAWADTCYGTKVIDHGARLARDYETPLHCSEAMIKMAMVDLISRRLTHESTPNWCDA